MVKRACTTIYGTGILSSTVRRTVFRTQAFETEFVGFDETRTFGKGSLLKFLTVSKFMRFAFAEKTNKANIFQFNLRRLRSSNVKRNRFAFRVSRGARRFSISFVSLKIRFRSMNSRAKQ